MLKTSPLAALYTKPSELGHDSAVGAAVPEMIAVAVVPVPVVLAA